MCVFEEPQYWAVLGSVGLQCVLHAPVAVTIVRSGKPAEPGR